MRKKKTSHVGNDVPPQKICPVIDLDPVNTDQLHHDVWNQLMERLKGTSNQGTALSVFEYWFPLCS